MKKQLETADAKAILNMLIEALKKRGYSSALVPDVFGILLLTYCEAAMLSGATKQDCEELVRYLSDKTLRLLGKAAMD